MATLATIPALRLKTPSRPQVSLNSAGGQSLPRSIGVFGTRRALLLSSRPWRTAHCRALSSDSNEPISTPPPSFDDNQPQVFYFAIANAQSLMLEGARLEVVLQDGIERAERAKRARDVWLIMEPAFLSQHPGLEALNGQLAKPTAAILSTNEDWMLSVVKKSLPQAVIGKFTSPSTAVPDPLKSNVGASSDVVGGGGVWH